MNWIILFINVSILQSSSSPPSFDMVARKGVCTGTIAVKHSEINKHVRACDIS